MQLFLIFFEKSFTRKQLFWLVHTAQQRIIIYAMVSEWERKMCIICNACAYFSHKWKCFSCFSSRNIDDDDDDEHQIRLSSFECPIDNLCLMCMIKSVCVCSLHACLLFIRLLFGQFHHKSFRCSQECSFILFFWDFLHYCCDKIIWICTQIFPFFWVALLTDVTRRSSM